VATATLLSVTNWPVGDYATVEVRFRGDLRRAPSMATKPLTIAYLDTLPPSFGFVLSDPDPSTATRSIVVESGVDGTGSPVVTAELSHDGIVWTEMPYARLLPWTLAAGDGLKTVWLRVTDAAGNVSGPGYYTIQLDTVAPTATAPTRSLVTGTAISASRLLARLAWSGSDVTSGIARYEIQQSTDAGAWSTVSTTLTSPTLDRLLAVSHRYAFRVRAIDEAGNTGTWMAGPTASLSDVSEKSSSIKFSSSWRQTYSTVFWGGGAKKSSTAGAKATVAFTGRSIALVSRLGPTRGRARIYVDGTLVTTVNLYASTYKSQRIVWARTFASSGKHAVSVVVYRTATRPRVDIDAFVVGG
jgi:hypothetical protein